MMCLLLSVLNESTTYSVRLDGAKVGKKANDEDDLSIRIEVGERGRMNGGKLAVK